MHPQRRAWLCKKSSSAHPPHPSTGCSWKARKPTRCLPVSPGIERDLASCQYGRRRAGARQRLFIGRGRILAPPTSSLRDASA
ncbi:hypothetical protein VULLAG_LOCUS9794 [Vulpes lagopus]